MNLKRLLIAEDQTILRSLLLRLLESYESIEVVGHSSDGKDACEKCIQLKPDIFILDITLPKLNGIEVLKRVKKRLPLTKVLILSETETKSIVSEVLQAGANGFVEKTAELDVFESAISSLLLGDNYFSPKIGEIVRDLVRNPIQESNPLDSLTEREREILQLVAEGNSSKNIANLLDISFKTAETHRSRIMAKLDMHNVAGLTRFAIAAGLLHELKIP